MRDPELRRAQDPFGILSFSGCFWWLWALFGILLGSRWGYGVIARVAGDILKASKVPPIKGLGAYLVAVRVNLRVVGVRVEVCD